MKKILMWGIGLILLFSIPTFIIQQQKSTETVVTNSSRESSETISEEIASSESVDSSSIAESSTKPTLNTTFEDTEGNIRELADMIDKPIILNIWASWCPPCREEMPYFQTAYDTHNDKINFIMLNATQSQPTETKEQVQSFVEEMGLTVPVYYDIEYNNMMKFGATVLPTTVLISSEGKVVEILRGMLTEEQLQTAVDKLTQ